MTRSSLATALTMAMALQVLLLSGMLVKAAIPLWIGTEIRIKTVPVDPRSMFRGNYARLSYEIGQLPDGALNDTISLRIGEIVYVSLQPGKDGLFAFANASLDKPTDGVFLRGRVVNDSRPFRVKYGIEAFFAPEQKALQLERELRNGGVAVLMITDGGRVALKDVVPNTVEK